MPRRNTELSAREREIVALVARGMTNGEIGRELFLSEDTVRKHVQRACVRLGTRGRAHLVAVVVREDATAGRDAPEHWDLLLRRERERRAAAERSLEKVQAERDAYRHKFTRREEIITDLRVALERCARTEGEKT
jgi:DNA-binding CsgD family transcriptional regulator